MIISYLLCLRVGVGLVVLLLGGAEEEEEE